MLYDLSISIKYNIVFFAFPFQTMIDSKYKFPGTRKFGNNLQHIIYAVRYVQFLGCIQRHTAVK